MVSLCNCLNCSMVIFGEQSFMNASQALLYTLVYNCMKQLTKNQRAQTIGALIYSLEADFFVALSQSIQTTSNLLASAEFLTVSAFSRSL